MKRSALLSLILIAVLLAVSPGIGAAATTPTTTRPVVVDQSLLRILKAYTPETPVPLTQQLFPYVARFILQRSTAEQQVADALQPYAPFGSFVTAAQVANWRDGSCYNWSADDSANQLTSLVPRASLRTMPAFLSSMALLSYRCNARPEYLDDLSRALNGYLFSRPLDIPKTVITNLPTTPKPPGSTLLYDTTCAAMGAGATYFAKQIKNPATGLVAAVAIAAGIKVCPVALRNAFQN